MGSVDLFTGIKKPTIDRPLIAYAFLAQAGQSNGDLLSGLAPIFKPIAKEWAGRVFDAAEFSKEVERLYQVRIHPWAVDDLAPRLAAIGLLTAHQVSAHVIEYTYAEITEAFDEVTETDIRLVIQRFVAFAQPILERYQQPVDEKMLESAFFNQLLAMDFQAVLLKPDRPQSSDRQKLKLPATTEQSAREQELNAQAKLDVLCAAFIVDTYKRDQHLYDLILRITTGAMVAEAVLNIQKPGSEISLGTLKIVLDGPFLMSLLDLSEEESTPYTKILCDQLREKGAGLLVFRHSIEEVQNNMKATLGSAQAGRGHGAMARRLGRSSYRTYAESVAQNLETVVLRHDIRIYEAPVSNDAYRYFTAADEADMCERLGQYENSLARERDAASIAAIMRMRLGRKVGMAKFHQAQYLFITPNTRVAARANTFTAERQLRSIRDVPPAMTDRHLAGLLFVLFGGEGKAITHYQLLANCAAALEPRNDVMNNMHRFLVALDPQKAEHFRALMTDERAGQHMMQLTMGDALCITSAKDAAAMLEEIESRLGEQHQQMYEERLVATQCEHAKALAEQAEAHQNALDGLVSNMQEQQTSAQQLAMDLAAATHRAENLTSSVAQLENLRWKDIQGRVEDCANHAKNIGNQRHREVALAIGALILLATSATAGLVEDELKIIFMGLLKNEWVKRHGG